MKFKSISSYSLIEFIILCKLKIRAQNANYWIKVRYMSELFHCFSHTRYLQDVILTSFFSHMVLSKLNYFIIRLYFFAFSHTCLYYIITINEISSSSSSSCKKKEIVRGEYKCVEKIYYLRGLWVALYSIEWIYAHKYSVIFH